MQKRAGFDLAAIALIFWGVWSLRFIGVGDIGIWTMMAAGGLSVALIVARKESWADYGLKAPESLGWTLRRAGEFALLVIVAGMAPMLVLTALGYPPSRSVALQDQPTALLPFLTDLVIGGWFAAGVGEEFFFRGVLLTKFKKIFGDGSVSISLAVIAQAVWFGAGHASQGWSGILAITILAGALAVFYLTRAKRNLIPLMIGHAFVDTVSLMGNYLTSVQFAGS